MDTRSWELAIPASPPLLPLLPPPPSTAPSAADARSNISSRAMTAGTTACIARRRALARCSGRPTFGIMPPWNCSPTSASSARTCVSRSTALRTSSAVSSSSSVQWNTSEVGFVTENRRARGLVKNPEPLSMNCDSEWPRRVDRKALPELPTLLRRC